MSFRSLQLALDTLSNQTLADSAQWEKMVAWHKHYLGETVDLRYFFHNGWSS